MDDACCAFEKMEPSDFVGGTPDEVRFGRRLFDAFKRAAEDLKEYWDDLSPQTADAVYRAILSTPWEEAFGPFATTWEETVRTVMTEAGEKEFKDLRGRVATPTSTLLTTSFTIENPYSRVYIRERSSRLIVQISDEQRETVKDILDKAIRNGEAPAGIRTRIGNVVGLHDRWASAVDRRYSLLLAEGVPEGEANRQASRYRDRLLRRRGENIARTEIISASNQGTLDSWNIAQDNGWINGEVTYKEWIAAFGSARTCEYCSALHGQQVKVNDTFVTEFGRIARPPLHPSCRCSFGLVFKD